MSRRIGSVVALAAILIRLFVWSIPAGRGFVLSIFIYGVLIALPMTRLAAAPLIVAAARHR